MRFLVLLAAALLLGRPALAQNANHVVPCATISPGAVTSVPAPFATYMQLVCYNGSGQALMPPDGTQWLDGNNALGLTSMDDRPGPDGQPHLSRGWYLSLTPREIAPADDAALHQVLLAQGVRPDYVKGAGIIELDAATVAGQVKQEFIVSPADPVATQGVKLLLECHEFCRGDDKPWILGIVPENAH
jgi:hypothetical protein